MDKTSIPDWIIKGAAVTEVKHGNFEHTTVKSITGTHVVLSNGSKYRRGSTLIKVGASGQGSGQQAQLMPASRAYEVQITGAVRHAATLVSRAAYNMSENGGDAAAALDQMAAVIESAKAQLASLLAARAAIADHR